jgi:hypothetical protein
VAGWAIEWRRVSAAARRSVALDDATVIAAIRQLGPRLGLRGPIKALLTTNAVEPGVFGIVSPQLLWPGISSID